MKLQEVSKVRLVAEPGAHRLITLLAMIRCSESKKLRTSQRKGGVGNIYVPAWLI